jgi:serine/threonine protein kinase
MHKHGFIHRDVKLDNIVFSSSDSHAKLTDFNVATKLEPIDQRLNNCEGTPAFTAPETYIPDKVGYEPRPTDIWSTGVSLFTYVTELVPFYAQSELEMQMNAKNSDPVMPDYFPEDLSDLTFKMLRKNPTERPTAVEALKHPFFKTS